MNVMSQPERVAESAASLLLELGVKDFSFRGGAHEVRSPITGEVIAKVAFGDAAAASAAIGRAQAASLAWRKVPAPRRGELVRLFGEELRAAKTELGRLVTLEAGKIISEGLGEVQEMIDICDFAVGLSRQLYGLTIATERAEHRMMETWHPLGVGRHHLRVQLPGRGLVLERGAGAGLRQSGRVEAVGEDAADCAGHSGAVRARGAEVRRRAGRVVGRPCRRARGRRGPGRRPAGPAGVRDRIDRDGPRGRSAACAALRPRVARAWRQHWLAMR